MNNLKSTKGWHGNSEDHARVGRLGGLATSKIKGADFYTTIGKLGGKVSPGNFKHNPERAREAGRIGGLARSTRG